MKLADINAIAGVLASLKVNRITDRAVKEEINNSWSPSAYPQGWQLVE